MDPDSLLKAQLLGAFAEITPGLLVGAFFVLGVAWVRFVGPLSGYFLAVITLGLAALIIGTIIYAVYRIRPR